MKFALLLLLATPQPWREVYLTGSPTAQNITDLATAFRSVLEIEEVAERTGSIAIRANFTQLEQAQWLIADFEQPPDMRPRAPHVFHNLRVFDLDPELRPDAVEERVALLHVIAGIRTAISYNNPRAIVVKGSLAEIALAQWLLTEIERPTPRVRDCPFPVGRSETVRILFEATRAPSVKGRREFLLTATKALVLRGPYRMVQR